ncbi:ribosome biogenesis protein RPF2 [Paraphysoderma sedebokerense]|nr:ribosome biogenesis protein RPF2 [Paraphysoderma sedebokerense]
MQRNSKAKNARSKRFLDKREAKVVENAKATICVRGTQTSAIINSALADIYSLKKPNAVNFSKKNTVHPFEDSQPLEFYSEKNDASLIVVGTHSKKRPHNLTFCRMFDHQVLDMFELGISSFKGISEFETPKCGVGMKPCILFQGEHWSTSEEYKRLQNYFLDFFRGELVSSVNLSGLEYIISITAGTPESRKIYLRVYTIHLKKSGQRLPRVELVEMGPAIDFELRRTQMANPDIWKNANKIPKELKPTKVKNVKTNALGEKFGRVHVGQQDLSQLQTRKMKALKRLARETEGEDVAEGNEKGAKKSKISSDEDM